DLLAEPAARLVARSRELPTSAPQSPVFRSKWGISGQLADAGGLTGETGVCVEDLAQERAQLRRFRFREGCREFCLHGVGRGLQFVEVSLAERGDGDGVAASICDVGR